MERYYYWKLSAGLNNRFIFKAADPDRLMLPCFLDLGIGYNLPIMYRYVGADQSSKSIRRFISNFNDFSATARLGFGILAVTGEYRLTDYIKPAYANVPRLMVGIDIIFPNN